MLNETEMLDYVYQATDMGRDGVASVLKIRPAGGFPAGTEAAAGGV